MKTEPKTVLGLRGAEVLLGDATGAVQAYSLDAFDFPPVYSDKVTLISFDNGSVRVIREGAAVPAAPAAPVMAAAAAAPLHEAAAAQSAAPIPPQPAATAPAPAAAPPVQEAPPPVMPPPVMDSAGASHAAPPMDPLEALTTVYIKKFADFFGRASRSEFWGAVLLFNVALTALMGALVATQEEPSFLWLACPIVAFFLIPNLAVMSRRLHDIGQSGWILLLGIVPIIGQIALLVLFAKKGKDTASRFAAAPPSAGVKRFAFLLSLGLAFLAISWVRQPALDVAAAFGNTANARLLMAMGADANHKDSSADIFGISPLYSAASQGRTDTVRLLLEKGADVNARRRDDNCEWTPLVTASYSGHTDVVRLLLENGADVNAGAKCDGNISNPTALDNAGNHIDIVRLLIEHGADVSTRPHALEVAVTNGYTAVARLLLDNGANVNATFYGGWTALMKAVDYGHTDTARLLLDKGANINATNQEGKTALTFAKEKGHTDIVNMLKAAGAKE